jgi:(p)ppGpp synthase/HD superfamily hydrolase
MIYTPLTNAAMKLAYRAHHGQTDYSGIPYIFHPIHLAEQMEDEFSCCVALLHDTVEDTCVTLDDLKLIFPSDVTDAVELLTHRDGTDYFEYVQAIRSNPIARKVKLADLAHNCDQSRCIGSAVTEEKKAAWQTKYEKATKILTEI